MDFVERVRHSSSITPIQQTSKVELKPVLKSLLERGFTREILTGWGINWDPEVHGMMLPVYDRTGELQGRIWRFPEGIIPKYRYAAGFEKSHILYGLWKLASRSPQVILVEGPLDAIWVQEAGFPGLAILGSTLSEQQAQLVVSLHPSKVILCFDNDEAGKLAGQKAVLTLKQKGCWVYKAKLPSKYKDIQEVQSKDVGKVLSNAELCVNGKGMVHPRYKRWFGKATASNGIWKS